MLSSMLTKGSGARHFSNRVVKYGGKNINVAQYNNELRSGVTGKVTFGNTFNMGYEGFSGAFKP